MKKSNRVARNFFLLIVVATFLSFIDQSHAYVNYNSRLKAIQIQESSNSMLSIVVSCYDDNEPFAYFFIKMVYGLDGLAVVDYQFDEEDIDEINTWSITSRSYENGTCCVNIPSEKIDEFIQNFKKHNSLTIKVTDYSDGEVNYYTFPLAGFTKSYNTHFRRCLNVE